MAPLAAVLVLVLVAGVTRLAFTGTFRFAPEAPEAASSGPGGHVRGAVLVVAGFGSTCCHDADALRAAEPGMLVRQFSYLGLDAAGQPIPYRLAAGNLSIQVLGDRMAAQVAELHQQAGAPVDVVAESEGTLGLYAMLARHPHLPIGSVVLLSPIVEPGQLGQAGGTVPGAALTTLNNLVGGMSPYGSSGARALIESVSEVGARYFAWVSQDTGVPWLAVVPLADAVTLPACPWPRNVIFIDAFHGGLLGDGPARRIVEMFLTSDTVPDSTLAELAGWSQQDLRRAAQLIAAAATAWRMPDLHPACLASRRGLPAPAGTATPGTRRARWRERAAIRYAEPRDANSPPAVVAPLLGGVLNQLFLRHSHDQKRPPRNCGRFCVSWPPPGPEP